MSKILFVNITKLCNVNCPRCYLSPESRADKLALDFSDLTKILDSMFFQQAEEVTVVLQGGEPTVLGSSRLRQYAACIRSSLPAAKIAMVSNLLNMPDWLIDFSHEDLCGRLETTYAAGFKYTLAGSFHGYQKKFTESLRKATASGLVVPVNVELNRETFEAGPGFLVDVAQRSGGMVWEFDFSVDFQAFHAIPLFNQYGYPVLKKTLEYNEFFDYVFRFSSLFEAQLGRGLQCGVIDQFSKGKKSINFNIQRENDFITLNPDGTVTTNPLFSDIRQTYIGNIKSQGLDEIVQNHMRTKRIIHEKMRIIDCNDCDYLEMCGGGVSHLPVRDKSNECVGGKKMWEKWL